MKTQMAADDDGDDALCCICFEEKRNISVSARPRPAFADTQQRKGGGLTPGPQTSARSERLGGRGGLTPQDPARSQGLGGGQVEKTRGAPRKTWGNHVLKDSQPSGGPYF